MRKIEFVEPKAIEAVECALCGVPMKRIYLPSRYVGLPKPFDGRFFYAHAAVVVNEGKLDISICDTCTAIACVEWAFATDDHTAARVARERLTDYNIEQQS